jgi:hypothetical protein
VASVPSSRRFCVLYHLCSMLIWPGLMRGSYQMFGYYPSSPQPPRHSWQGASRRWYPFTIYSIDYIPSFIKSCNYIFARPKLDNTREAFYIGESANFTRELENHPKLEPARRLGATEVHVHFLTASLAERLDVETDLRRGHWTPLNYQPTPAQPRPFGGFGALSPFGLGSGLSGVLDTRTDFDRSLAAMPPAPPQNALAGLASLAPPSVFRGSTGPFETDLDWLLRKR